MPKTYNFSFFFFFTLLSKLAFNSFLENFLHHLNDETKETLGKFGGKINQGLL